jgi:hypothetical protein
MFDSNRLTVIMCYLGNNWEAEYYKYMAKLKNAGLDKVLVELQSQVNAYVAKNGRRWHLEYIVNLFTHGLTQWLSIRSAHFS